MPKKNTQEQHIKKIKLLHMPFTELVKMAVIWRLKIQHVTTNIDETVIGMSTYTHT